MDHISKKRQLQGIISHQLTPLIQSDYVLYGLPYYKNVGDTLIWNGELEFLKSIGHKCVGVCGWSSYPGEKLPKETTVLITGGGYFGDVWRDGWEFALKGIKHLKDNPIIIMPASIWYESEELMNKDAEYLAQFKKLTICARDQKSYDIAVRNFGNPVILVPDMAFYMKERTLKKWQRIKPSKQVLYFKRDDKEFASSGVVIPEKDYDEHDWITMETELPEEEHFFKMLWHAQAFKKYSAAWSEKLVDWVYKYNFRKFVTKHGALQLADYHKIYTTRLHAMILGFLIGREIIIIDNSYGKLSSCFDTWLSDCDSIRYLQ